MSSHHEHQKFLPRSTIHNRAKKSGKLYRSLVVMLFLLLSIMTVLSFSRMESKRQLVEPITTEAPSVETEVVLNEEKEEIELVEEKRIQTDVFEKVEEIGKEEFLSAEIKPQQPSIIQVKNQQAIKEKEVISKINKYEPDVLVTHQVQPKETLYSITMNYYLNSSFQTKLADWNGINDPTIDVKVGMFLEIPDPLVRYHEIKSGETLFSITNMYYGNADYQQPLAIYNGITDPAVDVKKGMQLLIPQPHLLKDVIVDYRVEIEKSTNFLTVYAGTKVIKRFPIATGKDSTLTPEGVFNIVNKVEKPWYNKDDIPGGDPKNPLGSHWLGLNVPGTNGTTYGIHGTNNPDSIGAYVSLGCVRMHNRDVQWLYEHLPLQTLVHIY